MWNEKGKLVLLLVTLMSLCGLSGCGTLRGGVALVGGFGNDISQASQFVLEHTRPNTAPTYRDVVGGGE